MSGTAGAVSPDSGRPWTEPGAWPVGGTEAGGGIHRIPLPLPHDGLRAVNVYVVETVDERGTGLTLVDGGWAIPEARELLERSLRSIGAGVGDVRRFLVTHVHRDHYTMARVLGTETGAEVAIGEGERASFALLNDEPPAVSPFVALLRTAGAHDVAGRWAAIDREPPDPGQWAFPDSWLLDDDRVDLGTRTLEVVATPGHTPGHVVFADPAAGLLLAGDHVLPTITPSIGFSLPPAPQPLGDFMASLTRVRALPDLQVLPAHGPVGVSSHARIDELLAHHETRLAACVAALAAGAVTAADVAQRLGWTRHERDYASLGTFDQGLAALETRAHLELLVSRGEAARTDHPDGTRYAGTQGPIDGT